MWLECCFFLSDHSLWGKATSCQVMKTPRRPMKSRRGKAWRPPANNQQGLEACWQPCEWWGKTPSPPLSLEMTDSLTESSWKTLSRHHHPAKLSCSCIYHPLKLCEIMDVCCFKLLHLQIIYYTAIDTSCTLSCQITIKRKVNIWKMMCLWNISLPC